MLLDLTMKILFQQTNQNSEESNKPVKKKRRSSLTKGESTPRSTPKTQKTRKRTLKSKLDESVTDENSEKENACISQITTVSPVKQTLSPVCKSIATSKPVMAVCKDVTSRGENLKSLASDKLVLVVCKVATSRSES
jgi:hypothetical protein